MATDFFQRQDQAKRNTGRLIALLAAGMAAITVTTYLAAVFLLGAMALKQGGEAPPVPLWNGPLFVLIAGGTVAVVLGASLLRTAQLRVGGGAGVALAMGGRELAPGAAADADEKKLLNIVEEMAIASGVPMPRVFVMGGEGGINAFAAGWEQGDAVIGVTRGAVAGLSRDELQGVIAHEFSHILNGDMRRNIRLMGLVFGLLALAVVGRLLLQIGWYTRPSRDRDSKNDPRAVLAVVGLLLVVMGYVGAFFGHLMQAAISRQREFLADASAVQFTRNPAGLAGALKRIGSGSAEVSNVRAKEANHMFFGETSPSLFGFLASHPPLAERIRRLDPGWDGTYPSPRPLPGPSVRAAGSVPVNPFGAIGGAFPGLPGGVGGLGMGLAPSPVTAGAADPPIPSALHAAARDELRAGGVACALFMDHRDAAVRQRQQAAMGDAGWADATSRVLAQVAQLPEAGRLRLLDEAALTLANLGSLPKAQLMAQVDAVLGAAAHGSLYLWAARRVLSVRLESASSRMSNGASLREEAPQVALVLSVLARAGSRRGDAVAAAFAKGSAQLGLEGITLAAPEACRFSQLDEALDALACAAPEARRDLMQACNEVAMGDGRTTPVESDLLHAFAVSLEIA